MKSHKTTFLAMCRFFIFFAVITGIFYPLAMVAISKLLWPQKASGSLIWQNDQLIGSKLIGQQFESAKYFWGRPSASSYQMLPSGASNLSPISPKLKSAVEVRIAGWKAEVEGVEEKEIPRDLLFASGSGLDPHISPAAARFQAARVARARAMRIETLTALIDEHTEGRTAGFIGEPRVNVLMLNLELDRHSKRAF